MTAHRTLPRRAAPVPMGLYRQEGRGGEDPRSAPPLGTRPLAPGGAVDARRSLRRRSLLVAALRRSALLRLALARFALLVAAGAIGVAGAEGRERVVRQIDARQVDGEAPVLIAAAEIDQPAAVDPLAQELDGAHHEAAVQEDAVDEVPRAPAGADAQGARQERTVELLARVERTDDVGRAVGVVEQVDHPARQLERLVRLQDRG